MCPKGLLRLGNIRQRNTLSALNILRTQDALSRVELAAKLNCPGTAVTRIARELIAKGAVETAGMVASAGGRPRQKIRLNADWRQAIGIALSPESVTGVLCNLRGTVIVREQVFIDGTLDRNEFLDALELLARRLLDACERKKLLGMGLATFGQFADESKTLGKVAAYPSLEEFDMRRFFAEKFNVFPEIADASFARALYEIWFNNAGAHGGFLLFDVGSGIGCVTALEGRIVFDKFSNTGEFGHTIYKVDGAQCACGRVGCLETLCSTAVIEKRIREKKSDNNLKFSRIARAYNLGDREVEEVVGDCAGWLGIAIANQINFLIPDEVVLTGEMLQLGDKFFEQVLATVNKYAFPNFMSDMIIRKSDSWDIDASLGAASLIIRKVFEDK